MKLHYMPVEQLIPDASKHAKFNEHNHWT